MTATPWGCDGFGDGVGDLRGEALLHLQAAGEDIDEARDLGEADDLAVGDVGDVRLAEEGQQVVLAEGEEFDVLDDDHLVVVDVEEGGVEDGVDVHGVAAGEEGHGFFHALGGVEEAVAGGVFADAEEQFAVEILRAEGGGGERVRRRSVAHGVRPFSTDSVYSKELLEVSSMRTRRSSASGNALKMRKTSMVKFSVVETWSRKAARVLRF